MFSLYFFCAYLFKDAKIFELFLINTLHFIWQASINSWMFSAHISLDIVCLVHRKLVSPFLSLLPFLGWNHRLNSFYEDLFVKTIMILFIRMVFFIILMLPKVEPKNHNRVVKGGPYTSFLILPTNYISDLMFACRRLTVFMYDLLM